MKGTAINSYAPDFELPGIDGEVHHLARYLERYRAVAVIFMSNQCSNVHLYLERLKQLQQEYADVGVTLIGINANDAIRSPEDSFENMKEFAQSNHLNFPYIRDVTQDVAHCFGAKVIPEVFLLDQQGIIRYRGQIDDNPNSAESVSRPYLKVAIAQLLQGEVIQPSTTEAVGDALQWR
ncbi:thioredoxin family protein [Capilliphycus salinus ALCB114379]|uniref:thioredoxin family protein n=1 Tax=Capilliphycus salinus TaxID=2768948 RepID=UPI0039A66C87